MLGLRGGAGRANLLLGLTGFDRLTKGRACVPRLVGGLVKLRLKAKANEPERMRMAA